MHQSINVLLGIDKAHTVPLWKAHTIHTCCNLFNICYYFFFCEDMVTCGSL